MKIEKNTKNFIILTVILAAITYFALGFFMDTPVKFDPKFLGV